MLFKDELQKIRAKLEPEMDRLIALALSNQDHEGDLLLTVENGTFDESLIGTPLSRGQKGTGHCLGLHNSGLSDATQYDFINLYRKQLAQISFEEFLNKCAFSNEDKEEREELLKAESLSIHLETLVYLKIWESEHFLKRWYHLVRCLHGEPYDWEFRFKSNPKDERGHSKRHEVIRIEIRDRLTEFSELLSSAFQNAYNSQVRNAIAHSLFAFHGRNMNLHNYHKNDIGSPLKNLPFDEWVNMFHYTIELHNMYIYLKQKVSRHYGGMFLSRDKPQEVRSIDNVGAVKLKFLSYDVNFERWYWA